MIQRWGVYSEYNFISYFKSILNVFYILQERSTQSRILDLETQLSQTRAEIARIKREKEEVITNLL